MLKLQQEITAMRVVISMENNIDFDTSKMHTIKRYMSELKDEDSVSNGGLRCRELDCLRAYYFVAILNFLRKTLEKKEDVETKNVEVKSEIVNIDLSTLEIKSESTSSISEIGQNVSTDEKKNLDEKLSAAGKMESNEKSQLASSELDQLEDNKSEQAGIVKESDQNKIAQPEIENQSSNLSKADIDQNSLGEKAKDENIDAQEKSDNHDENSSENVELSVDKDNKTVERQSSTDSGCGTGARPKTFKFMT